MATLRSGAKPAQPHRVAATSEKTYGPFSIVAQNKAVLVGPTGPDAPAQFDRMLADYPDLKILELREVSGTTYDIANIELGRRIRASGLRTHVPDDGSVRSGGVELFLAGRQRSVECGAEFAVHAWEDQHGRGPEDFASDSPANRLYLDYYIDMGMPSEQAQQFYAFTNSASNSEALWLSELEMIEWINARIVEETGAVLETCRGVAMAQSSDAEVRLAAR